MVDVKELNEEGKEKLIERYSYFCSDSKDFVETYLECYIEMEYILDNIAKNINDMKKEYNIKYYKNECALCFESKKQKGIIQ